MHHNMEELQEIDNEAIDDDVCIKAPEINKYKLLVNFRMKLSGRHS